LIQTHVRALEENKWIDLPTLLNADRTSPFYTDRDKAQVLYGESWALTHMLMLSDRYGPKYPELMRALRGGAGQEEAFQKVFGKPLNRVQDELFGYLRGDWFKVVYFDAKLVKSPDPPQVELLSDLQGGLVLASLLHQPEKKKEAQALLAKLAQQHPDSWEVAEAQGYFDWQRESNPESARQHFRDAAQRGSTSPRLYYDLAMLSRKGGDDNNSVIPLLQKALALDPDFAQARIQLATALYNERLYAQAIEAYATLNEMSHEEAQRKYSIVAYSYHALQQDEEARKAAEQLLEASETAEEVTRAKQLLAMVSQPPPQFRTGDRSAMQTDMNGPAQRETSGDAATQPAPRLISRAPVNPDARPALRRRAAPQSEFVERTEQGPPITRIEGMLYQFDCLGSVARLIVTVAGKRLALVIDDPSNVRITGRGNGSLDFSCGRQQPLPVAIEYEDKTDAKLGTAGVIHAIEFK
jgi:tetratricopeptide (TPR) repeat protein